MKRSAKASPLVSVLIPTYNRAHLVGRAIWSVLRQTSSDFELVVVDDGSTDNTLEVIERFQDPRIRLVRLAGNYGVSHARNVGVQAARGELVAFLDSDDEWLPPKLELQLARLRECDDPQTTVVHCQSHTERKQPLPDLVHEGDVFDHLLRGWLPWTPTILAKRSSLLDIGGFDERMVCAEDYDLYLRLAEAANHFAAVPEVLAVRNIKGGSQLTSDPGARLRAILILDRTWGSVVKHRVGAAPYRRWKAALYAGVQYAQFMQVRETVAHGDRMAAWRYCLAMCRYLPWSRRFLIQGLAVTVLGWDAYRWLARVRDALVRGVSQ